jgi:protein disulfide-isomerase A6
MVQSLPVALTAASLLLLPSALADGLYPKSSSVLQVSGKDYDSLIAKSNYTVSLTMIVA